MGASPIGSYSQTSLAPPGETARRMFFGGTFNETFHVGAGGANTSEYIETSPIDSQQVEQNCSFILERLNLHEVSGLPQDRSPSATDLLTDTLFVGAEFDASEAVRIGRFEIVGGVADFSPSFAGEQTLSGTATLTSIIPVPEPSTALLLGLGFVGLIGRRRTCSQ